MVPSSSFPWAHWPTSWGGVVVDDDYKSVSGDPGVDAYVELSRYVPGPHIDAILLMNTHTGSLEGFWAKPRSGVSSVGFESVKEKYYPQFRELHLAALKWSDSGCVEADQTTWSCPGDDNIRGRRIRKCILVYRQSDLSGLAAAPAEFMRFKEYVYDRIVGRPIFSRGAFDARRHSPEDLFERYFGPLFYRQSLQCDCFTWPWQSGDLGAMPVPTISLVFDIRTSTLSYAHTSDKVAFVRFISRAKRIAREKLLQYGGVFSMDTGDGIVGNFTPRVSRLFPSDAHLCQNIYVDAVNCAVGIVADVGSVVDEFKATMDHWLDGLDAAVGLHQSDAQWINVDGACEAVGDSVIFAHRICSQADGGTVLYSQSIEKGLVEFGGNGGATPRARKVKKKLKDIPGRGKWRGYQIRPRDCMR